MTNHRTHSTRTSVAILTAAGVLAWITAGCLSDAFAISIHEEICQEILGAYSMVVDGELLAFTQDAIDEIRDANADTDDIENQLFESKAHFHFDSEKLYKGSYRLIEEKRNAVLDLVLPLEPDGEEARKHLGGGLHTLQDFYAHSNWANFHGKNQIHTDLGSATILNPPKSSQFCPKSVGELQGPGLTELTSGYFVIPWACLALVSPPLIYACAALSCDDVPYPGKCRHGLDYTFCEGINKDDDSRPLHDEARNQAELATIDYLEKLLSHPLMTGHPDKLKMIKALFGMSTDETKGAGDLVIVVDDTGSMGDDINQVKAQVADIVAGSSQPAKYVLVRFGDPSVGLPFTTTDSEAFMNKVNELSPYGGGDCPEKSMEGLLKAISASSKKSNIFLFTDADAKDQSLASQVSTNANAKDITIYAVLSSSCNRRRQLAVRGINRRMSHTHDPAYFQVTESTGGQVFVVARGDVGSVFDFLRPQLSDSFSTIIRKRTDHSGAVTSTNIFIPIDSTIGTVVISVTYKSDKTVTLARPDGSIVDDDDEKITVTEQAQGIFYTILEPASGRWDLSVEGPGAFSILVKASGSLQFSSFKLVEPKVTHGGLAYQSIGGQPIIASSPAGVARLAGPHNSVSFRLVDQDGYFIEAIDLVLGSPLAAQDKWSGNVPLPSIPFRVEAFGTDLDGWPFQRVYPELFIAQPLAVDIGFNTSLPYLPFNMTVTTIHFEVHNYGEAAATFEMLASDDRAFVTGAALSLSYLTVNANSSSAYDVDLQSPPANECVQDLRVALTVTATSTSDRIVSNSRTVILYTDCDFALKPDPEEAFMPDTSDPSSKTAKTQKKSSQSTQSISSKKHKKRSFFKKKKGGKKGKKKGSKKYL